MYTIDYKMVRINAQRANTPKRKSRIKVMSTCHPDTTDFNAAAMHRKKELDKMLMP